MRPAPICVAASMVLVLCACDARSPSTRAPVDTAKIVDAIKTDEVHWNNDWRSGDAAVLAGHYAATATVMSPGAKPRTGLAAIRSGMQEALEDKSFSLTFASDRVDVAASGDLAAAHGSYKQTSTDPHTGTIVTETGAYVTVYKPQSDGAWKAIWDINTPGAPPEQETH